MFCQWKIEKKLLQQNLSDLIRKVEIKSERFLEEYSFPY